LLTPTLRFKLHPNNFDDYEDHQDYSQLQ